MLITYPDSNNLSAYTAARNTTTSSGSNALVSAALHEQLYSVIPPQAAQDPPSNTLNHEFQPRRRRGGRRRAGAFNLIGYTPRRNKYFHEFRGQGAAPNACKHRQGPSYTKVARNLTRSVLTNVSKRCNSNDVFQHSKGLHGNYVRHFWGTTHNAGLSRRALPRLRHFWGITHNAGLNTPAASELLVVLRVLVGLAAARTPERADRRHLLRRQREGEDIEVLALTLRVTRLGQGQGAELVVPAQNEA